MKIIINRSFLTFTTLAIIGALISLLSVYILPERFFFDANIIIFDKYNEIGLKNAYPISIFFYSVTKLKYLPFPVIGVLQYSFLIFIVYKIGVPKNFYRLTIKNCLIYLSFLLIAIFISMPSKEFLTFLFIASIVFLFKRRNYGLKKTLFLSFILFAVFAYFFRSYFIFLVLLPISMNLISYVKFKNKRLATISMGLLILIFISISHGLIKGVFISENTRYALNLKRGESENANSMIISPIEPTTWYGESFGILYGFFSVNFPINAIKHILSPQILLFSIWQIALFIVFIIKYKNCIKEGRKDNYDLWLFYFLFSYFIIQGLFEPDLGSSIRHKAGIFPLIYYLMYYEDFRKKL